MLGEVSDDSSEFDFAVVDEKPTDTESTRESNKETSEEEMERKRATA